MTNDSSLLLSLKMFISPDWAENTLEIYGDFMNSFHPNVNRLIRRRELS